MFLYFKIMFHYSGTILDLHSFQFIHSVMPNSLQPHALQGFPGGTSPKEPACQCRRVRDRGSIPGSEDPLEEKMATHSSILAWRIPWTEEPDRLQSMGSQRVRHGWSNKQLNRQAWTAACQASLSTPNSQILLKLMSTELVMPVSHLTPCHALLSCLQPFPASGSFLMRLFFPPGDQSIGASASVLSMNIKDRFPLGLTGLISLLPKGLSWVFSNTTV